MRDVQELEVLSLTENESLGEDDGDGVELRVSVPDGSLRDGLGVTGGVTVSLWDAEVEGVDVSDCEADQVPEWDCVGVGGGVIVCE